MPARLSKTIKLAEYAEPNHWVTAVDLTFRLDPKATRVVAKIRFEHNPNGNGDDLVLDGAELKLISASIGGTDMTPLLDSSEGGLRLAGEHVPKAAFEWECETEINPQDNTSLEGLYMSNGMYCTQCEAEGFRKITYYPDRPDVMSTFRVRIEGDQPVMLSNGNLIGTEPGAAEWHDPWPKPAYLFALVAGDLVSLDDQFMTASGRKVDLKIFVRPGDEGKCDYAMDALKRSMRWDEQAYGREYDLDLFMIVAVDDFNMGAMENKGLNIFNSKYVLASPETATDTDYGFIEGIIAHEYFHNWTGNRITCRDWFQLCLKEGLTVFRDQQFSADERSEAVQRISDVQALRMRQFREDAGPLAHPVRPEEYIEINNFYTSTVYEKGAEVIRMLHTMIGAEAYRKGTDLYFERHDGQACTIEHWIKVFEDTTGQDLSAFANWYSQAGTPEVTATESYANGTYRLTLTQETRPTPGQPSKEPQVIPMNYGFLNDNGAELGDAGQIILTKAKETFTFDLPSKPVASLFRGFSAPVILHQSLSARDRALMLAHDPDPFNRWEAGHKLALDTLLSMSLADTTPDPVFLDAMRNLALDDSADPAFRALVLQLPSESEITTTIAAQDEIPDPNKIRLSRLHLQSALADALGADAQRLYETCKPDGPYAPDAKSAGLRDLRNRMLVLLCANDPDAETAHRQYETADNMTDTLAALRVLVVKDCAAQALARFEETWAGNANVMDKWFALQASLTPPETVLERVNTLTQHAEFHWKTPNRFRALVGAFALNHPTGFHDPSGAGYAFVTDWLLKLDPLNPQTAARLTTAFDAWKIYDTKRQSLMQAQLERLEAETSLSKDAREMVERILKA